MDHPLAAPDTLIRPWRTAAYVAGTIALVELLLLLVIGGGALVHTVSDRIQLAAHESAVGPMRATAKPARQKSKPAPTPTASLPRAKTVVLVLNGNGRTGAAAAASARVKRHGYSVGAVGNAPRSDFRKSLIMYRPGFAGEGHRLAKDLRVTMVSPLDGMRVDALGKAHVVFIIGS